MNLRPDIAQVDPGWFANPGSPYRVRSDGGVVAIVPIGQSLLSVPFYVVGRAGAQFVEPDQRDQFVRTATFFTGSLLLALTAAIVAAIARELSDRQGVALLLGYIYAFGTYALGNADTYLTEIGTSFFLGLSCWFAIRTWNHGGWRAPLCSGLAIGAAFMVRPSAGLFLPVVGLCLALTVWRRQRLVPAVRAGALYSAGAVAMLAVNALFAWWRFESPFDLGYQQVFQSYPLISGLTGQAWSTGKGLIWYAPIVVLSAVGAVMLAKTRLPAVLLLVAAAAANTVFYARVPFWAGDNSWGPRYTLIILPMLVPLAIGVVRLRAGLRAIQVAGVVGLLLPGVPGTMVNFNVLYVEATRELEGGATAAIHHQIEWQPILNQLRTLPVAVSDLWGSDPEGEIQRPAYTRDPNADYGFYAIEPRLDVWWAWVGPTSASGLTWVFLVPSVVCLGIAGKLVADDRRASRGRPGRSVAPG
jgi:hypothetical protein